MSSSKTLLLATAFATILSLPAYATDAPPASFDGTAGTNAVKAAPGDVPADGAAPTTMDPTSSPPTALAAPTTGSAPAADAPPTDMMPAETAPAVPATPAMDPIAPAPTPEDEMAAPDTPVSPDPTMTATPEPAPTPAPDAATTMAPEEPTPTTDAATPVVPEEPAPAPEPEKKKVSPPAKLSALSKKYDLLGLDTNGDKSLSKAEFTANGFANAKVFARFDADGNGKLTNSEMNAYASNIEANSKR